MVCGQDSCSTPCEWSTKRFLHQPLPHLSIHSAQDIIHEEDARTRVQSSGQGHSPLLAAAQGDALGSYDSQIALLQSFRSSERAQLCKATRYLSWSNGRPKRILPRMVVSSIIQGDCETMAKRYGRIQFPAPTSGSGSPPICGLPLIPERRIASPAKADKSKLLPDPVPPATMVSRPTGNPIERSFKAKLSSSLPLAGQETVASLNAIVSECVILALRCLLFGKVLLQPPQTRPGPHYPCGVQGGDRQGRLQVPEEADAGE